MLSRLVGVALHFQWCKEERVKIVTWNVNSINARLETVLAWVDANRPDVLLLQEIKCVTSAFPAQPFEERGYNLAIHGQKTYNGVAILSKLPLEDVTTSLPGDEADAEARYVEAVTGQCRVASIYVPNGRGLDSDRYPYKLAFMERFEARMREILKYDEISIIGGDYNIAPFAEDMFDPNLSGTPTLLCSPLEQEALRRVLNLGMFDAIRILNTTQQGPAHGLFTWWDYRQGAFPKNEGFRIDHLILSPRALDTLKTGGIDVEVRGQKQASDHAPVWVEIAKVS